MPIEKDTVYSHDFIVTDTEMRLFEKLSNDRSSIHTDDSFAKMRGFERAIVYGGIMIAQLSYVVGTLVPGDRGTSLQWRIDYRQPLYVQEAATLRIRVTNVSHATGVVDCEFQITTKSRIVASGTTRSIVPPEDIA